VEISAGAGNRIELRGMKPGLFQDWDAQSVVSSGRLPLSLVLHDTYVGSWHITVSAGADVRVFDSELSCVSLELAECSGTIAGLRPGHFDQWDLAQFGLRDPSCELTLENTAVGEWVLRDGSGCSLSIEDSVISLVLWGQGLSLAAKRSSFTWVGLDDVPWADFAMEDCTLAGYLRLVNAHFSLGGSVRFLRPLEIGAWHSSSVRRGFEAIVEDKAGAPLGGAAITVLDPSGREVAQGFSTAAGLFSFKLTFDDRNRSQTWSIVLPAYGLTRRLGFLTDTPLLLSVP